MIGLTKSARARVEALKRAEDDASVLAANATKMLNELREDLFKARAADNAAEIRRLEEEVGVAEETHRRRLARRANHGQLLAQIGRWLQQLPRNVVLDDVAPPKLKLRAGETHMDGVERACAALNAARAELQAVQAAPLSRAELRQKAAAIVATLAESGRPKLTANRGTFNVNWHPDQSWQQAGSGALAHIAFLCWYDQTAMTARLNAELETLDIDDSKAIGADERARRVAELEATILQAERDECGHIAAAQASGMDMHYRNRTNPLAVLHLRIRTRAVKAA